MDNIYESNIEEMITELNDIKDNTIDTNVSDLNKSQISVLSMDSVKAVIQFNFNTNRLKESSNCDEINTNDNNSPDNSDPNSRYNDRHPSQRGVNDNDNKENDGMSGQLDQRSDQSFKGRSSRRTISESNNEDSTKGILKYSHNWIRRTVSESNCDSMDPDLELLSLFWHSVEDIESDDEFFSEKKPKKNVRFSDNVSQTVFRPNSSILGRKSKNQKRAKNRKNSIRKSKTDETTETEYKDGQYKSERNRQDSGYDSEDNVINSGDDLPPKKQNKQIETGIKELSLE